MTEADISFDHDTLDLVGATRIAAKTTEFEISELGAQARLSFGPHEGQLALRQGGKQGIVARADGKLEVGGAAQNGQLTVRAISGAAVSIDAKKGIAVTSGDGGEVVIEGKGKIRVGAELPGQLHVSGGSAGSVVVDGQGTLFVLGFQEPGDVVLWDPKAAVALSLRQLFDLVFLLAKFSPYLATSPEMNQLLQSIAAGGLGSLPQEGSP